MVKTRTGGEGLRVGHKVKGFSLAHGLKEFKTWTEGVKQYRTMKGHSFQQLEG